MNAELSLIKYILLSFFFVLSGCDWIYGGEAVLETTMHRDDGTKVSCESGVYASGGLINGEKDARRIMNACVLACRKKGFVEDGARLQIDEQQSKLAPEEGWANTPNICQN